MTTPSIPPNEPAKPAATDVDELDERDPGLALERTSLAWTRTAISFAALGGVVLKVSFFPGLIIVLMAPLVGWVGGLRKQGPDRLLLITIAIVVVAILSLLIALISHGASRALHS